MCLQDEERIMGKNSRLGVLVGKTKTDEGCHLINEGVCVYEFVSVCVFIYKRLHDSRGRSERHHSSSPVRGRRSGMVKCWWGWSSFSDTLKASPAATGINFVVFVLFPLTSQCEGALHHNVHKLAM